MVTQLLQAATFDVLHAAKAKQALEANYPKPLREYLSGAKEEALAKDATAILNVLGSGTSIMNEAWRLTQSKNGFFHAFLESLKEMRSYEHAETLLGKTLTSFRTAGGKYERVLTREMQTLLNVALEVESPIVQVAAPAEIDTTSLPGIPEITVQRSLLGGARMFYKGTLTDNSWRARLIKILSAVS